MPPFPSLTSFTVDRYSSRRPSSPIFPLPRPLPRHRMCHRTRARPPAVSLACKSPSLGGAEQLFRVSVQFLGHVFHPAVVPDGVSGQCIYCGYVT